MLRVLKFFKQRNRELKEIQLIDHILRKLFAFSILWNFNVLVSSEINIPCPPVHPNGILHFAITDKKELLNIRNEHKWESTKIVTARPPSKKFNIQQYQYFIKKEVSFRGLI